MKVFINKTGMTIFAKKFEASIGAIKLKNSKRIGYLKTGNHRYWWFYSLWAGITYYTRELS